MHAADRRLAASLASGDAVRAAQKCRFLGLLGAFRGGAYTHGRHPNRKNRDGAGRMGPWRRRIASSLNVPQGCISCRMGASHAAGLQVPHAGLHLTPQDCRRCNHRLVSGPNFPSLYNLYVHLSVYVQLLVSVGVYSHKQNISGSTGFSDTKRQRSRVHPKNWSENGSVGFLKKPLSKGCATGKNGS